MHDIDAQASGPDWGVPSLALMESAGAALARACVEELGGSAGNEKIAIACGKGNNGGDGFVAARHLAGLGARVTLFLTCAPDDLKGDPAVYFGAAKHIARVAEVGDLGEADAPPGALGERYDLWVDCLLGTGAKGAPRGPIARLVMRINGAKNNGVPVVACDIPSGVDADTGNVADENVAVQATRTITFALPKPGLLQYPGADFAGRVTLADIGLPRPLVYDYSDPVMELTTQDEMRDLLPPRTQSRDANKGAFGTVLVIAGSHGMAGAACLSAVSALRAGAGLVMLAVPESLLDTAATLAPEVILRGLPETPEKTHGGTSAVEAALALAEKADAVAIGPGVSSGNTNVVSFVQALIAQIEKPLVVDADGLNALAQDPKCSQNRKGPPLVLTPHPGETGRLLNKPTGEVQADRLGSVRECAEKYHAVALLKGTRTLIAEEGGKGNLAFNRKGSVALATAGSGDVLTGVIGALLAQKSPALSPYDAARAGAYLHALAGERAERDLGRAGALAGDIRDRLPQAREMLYSEELDEL